MAQWRSAGKHLYYVQEDLLVVRAGGTLDLQEARWLMATTAELVRTYGYSLMLADVSAGLSIPPEVRRWIGGWHKENSAALGSAVVVGAGALARTLITMINSGVRLLGLASGDLVFAGGEAEGWALIAQRRSLWRERLARRAAPAKLG